MKRGISVIIPTYNREKFITECIQSVLDQDYNGNLEVIISDDGSTDNTLEIARSFNDKVKILEKPKSCLTQGVSGTRNRGIKASTQPYICFLDSDDFFLPHHLKKMVVAIEKNPETSFAFCRILDVKEENKLKLFRPWTVLHVFKNDIKNLVVSRNMIVHTNGLIFKREVFQVAGYFNESYSNDEDGDMWMRINELFNCEFSEHYGAVYRTNHGISQLTNKPMERRSDSYLNVFENALNRYYELELKDKFRKYKLEKILLNHKFIHDKFSWRWRYCLLILKFPCSYLCEKKYNYFENRDKMKMKEWHELKFFL